MPNRSAKLIVVLLGALAVAACSTTPADVTPASATASETPTANASDSQAAQAGLEDVPVIPGYAPGEFPPVPAITLPDITLLSDSAPAFSVSLEERFAELQGVKVSAGQCSDDGSLSTTSLNTSLYDDASKTVTTPGDGSGTYDDAAMRIVNNGDGTGSFDSAAVYIEVQPDGAGIYDTAALRVEVDGKGAGFWDTAAERIENHGNGSGFHDTAGFKIINNGDGSGSYDSAGITIINDGAGKATIDTAGGQWEVEVKPLGKLAPVGSFPRLEALTPQNVCGVVITVESEVLFDFGSSEVRSDAAAVLSDVAVALNEVGAPAAEVIGHTDSIDTDEFNQRLSEARANAVVEALKADGVTASLTATGKGESEPVAPNENADGSDNPSGRQLNRRVEIFIPAF